MLGVELRPERERVRVVADGELDLATAPALDDQLRELHRAGFAHVVVDLRRLTFIDCAGLRALLDAHARAAADSTKLTLLGGPPVRRLLALTGADRQLPLDTSAESSDA